MIACLSPHAGFQHVRSALRLALSTLLLAAGLASMAWAESGQDPVTPCVSFNGQINSVALSTQNIQGQHIAYVAGSFNYVGYRAPALALLDATTGIPQAGFPWANSTVYAVIPDGNGGWWVAGQFSDIGSDSWPETGVNYICDVASNNTISTLPLSFNGLIQCLVLNGTTLYIGGNFNTVSGYTRNYACAVNVASGGSYGQLLAWNPNCNNVVSGMVIAGTGYQQMWLMGSFNTVGGISRQYLCAVDLVNGVVGSFWNQELDATPNCHQLVGTNLYIGCNNGCDVGYRKSGLACYQPANFTSTSCQPLSSFPSVSGGNAIVYCCIPDGQTGTNEPGWYIAGNFTAVGSTNVSNLAHLHQDGTVDTSYLPNPNNTVRALLLSGGELYVGGNFTSISTVTRDYIAAIDPVLATATSWNPGTNGVVYALAAINGDIWAGGAFSFAGGSWRANLAELSPGTGLATSWDLGINTSVYSLDSLNNALYVGGYHYYTSYFSGYYCPNLIGLSDSSSTNGQQVPSFPATNGTVDCEIPDGNNGWYIGGSFSQIGNVALSNLVHVNPDFSIDTTFTPQPNSTVNSLYLASSSLLYVGGSFGQIGGASNHTGIAALNLGSGQNGTATAWAPGVSGGNGAVYSIAIDSSGNIYAGGSFTTIGGNNISNLAQLSPTTGVSTPTWTPNPNSQVNSLVFVPGTPGQLFVGGPFSQILGAGTHAWLCAFNTATLGIEAWSAGANSTVDCLTLDSSGTNLYVGGYFNTLGGGSQTYAGEVTIATGTETVPGLPSQSNPVNQIAVGPVDVYIGGQSGLLSAVTATTNTVDSSFSNPLLTSNVYTVSISGTTIAVGGTFQYSNTSAFQGLQAFDLTLATPLAGWTSPTINGQNIYNLAISSDSTPELFAAGDFSQVGSSPRTGIVKLNASTGTVDTTFNASINAACVGLTVVGPTLYFAGAGTSIAGNPTVTRLNAGAVDEATGNNPTLFNPAANAQVDIITPSADGSVLMMGGSFTFTGWSSRNGALEIDTTTGLGTAWNPQVSGDVYGMCADSTNIIVGGYFTQVDSQGRNYIAAIDQTSGVPTSWNPGANYYVNTVAAASGTIYAAGDFVTLGGASRNQIGAISDSTGIATAWNPSCNTGSNIRQLIPTPGTSPTDIIAAGNMDWWGGGGDSGLAAINLDTGAPLSWSPSTNGTVYSLSCDPVNDIVYLGGTFTNVNGQTRDYLASINGVTQSSPATTTSWVANTNNTVDTVLYQGGTTPTLYFGGIFSSATGSARNCLAAIVIGTGTGAASVTSWAPNPDNEVDALALNGQVLYTGGTFLNVLQSGTAVPSTRLAAYDFSNSGLQTAWNPTANGQVLSLLVDGGTIYAGGEFNQLSGQTADYIGAISATGSVITGWNPSSNGYIQSMVAGNQDVVIGGGFSYIDGYSDNQNLDSLNPGSGTAFGNWPEPNGTVYSLARYNNEIVVAGNFGQFISTATGATILANCFGLVPLAPVSTGPYTQADLNTVLANFGHRITDPGWNAAADINGDGVVNIDDVNLVLENFEAP